MTIAVYGSKAGRTHENLMLQAFLERLEERWGASADWIVVIANSMWNGAEIDLVCILPSALLVADFKAHGGRLTGTENGPWRADGVIVRGGRKDNPYQQLRDNKFAVLNWLRSKSLLEGRNLGHIAGSLVFSRTFADQLDLSPKVRSWFHPTDLDNCATLIDGLASPEMAIDEKEAREIVRWLGVQPVNWKLARPTVHPVNPGPLKPQPHRSLTEHQGEALRTLHDFIESEDLVSFAVLGMTSTGKTRLIHEVVEELLRAEKHAIVLAPNRRLADAAGTNADSIYAHLYMGNASDEEEVDAPEEDRKKLKIIPLRECNDEEDCVYLVDDAHLLGNSPFHTPDGKQYGSGQLLSDFFDFVEPGKSGRKVIFFGDPYQIQRAGAEESVLTGAFQAGRGLKHHGLELMQLVDDTDGSARLANALALVSAIRSERFADFELATDDGLRVMESREAAARILDQFRSVPHSTWYLAETHAKANVFTSWLRRRLHRRKLPGSIEPGDLLEIYVGPDGRSDPDPFNRSMSIHSGETKTVAHVGERVEYAQGLRWAKNGTVRFHSISCEIDGGNGSEINLFEEFLTAAKPELDRETAVAENVWRNAKINAQRKAADGQQSEFPIIPQPLLPPPPPEFVYARYGYAATVHHAQGMSRPICYLNCDHAAGRHSEGFFRWLYSALTVAERELILVNFTEIHPFDSAVWNAGAVTTAVDIPVGAGWTFRPDGVASERDQLRSLPAGLDESKDLPKSVAIWLHIARVVEKLGWHIASVASHPYQEQYELAGPDDGQCKLRVSYNGRNVVTAIHAGDAASWPLLADVAAGCVEMNDFTPEAAALLHCARMRLSGRGWKVVSSIETAYRLTSTVVRGPDERIVIEINFDKQGLVSGVRPLRASHADLPDGIRDALL